MRFVINFFVLLLTASPSYSSDLIDVYEQAMKNNPQVHEAFGNLEAARANTALARSAYFPQLNATIAGSYNDDRSVQDFPVTDQAEQAGARGVSNRLTTLKTTGVYGINLQQGLFSHLRKTTLEFAKTQTSQSECDYKEVVQRMMFEVGNAYFNVVSAEESLEAQRSARQDLQNLWQESKLRVEAGTIAMPDVLQAEAAYYAAEAAVANAQSQLDSAQLALVTTAGGEIGSLRHLSEHLALDDPVPDKLDDWLVMALQSNPVVCSSRLALDLATLLLRSKRDGRLPTISLIGSYSMTSGNGQGTTTLIDMETGGFRGRLPSPPVTDQGGWGIGIQLEMPIYSGGAISARIRQASAQRQATEAKAVQTLRDIEQEVRDSYLSVVSSISQVNRRKLAFEASTAALQATEEAYDIGTRTAAELLLVRQQLLQSRLNYSQSRIAYVLSVMRLQHAAGLLSYQFVQAINSRLAR